MIPICSMELFNCSVRLRGQRRHVLKVQKMGVGPEGVKPSLPGDTVPCAEMCFCSQNPDIVVSCPGVVERRPGKVDGAAKASRHHRGPWPEVGYNVFRFGKGRRVPHLPPPHTHICNTDPIFDPKRTPCGYSKRRGPFSTTLSTTLTGDLSATLGVGVRVKVKFRFQAAKAQIHTGGHKYPFRCACHIASERKNVGGGSARITHENVSCCHVLFPLGVNPTSTPIPTPSLSIPSK